MRKVTVCNEEQFEKAKSSIDGPAPTALSGENSQTYLHYSDPLVSRVVVIVEASNLVKNMIMYFIVFPSKVTASNKGREHVVEIIIPDSFNRPS